MTSHASWNSLRVNPKIKLFEENSVLNRIDFGGKRARYEELDENSHHDHLIDVESGEIIEFLNEDEVTHRKRHGK